MVCVGHRSAISTSLGVADFISPYQLFRYKTDSRLSPVFLGGSPHIQVRPERSVRASNHGGAGPATPPTGVSFGENSLRRSLSIGMTFDVVHQSGSDVAVGIPNGHLRILFAGLSDPSHDLYGQGFSRIHSRSCQGHTGKYGSVSSICFTGNVGLHCWLPAALHYVV